MQQYELRHQYAQIYHRLYNTLATLAGDPAPPTGSRLSYLCGQGVGGMIKCGSIEKVMLLYREAIR